MSASISQTAARLSPDKALALFQHGNPIDLGERAHEVRLRIANPDVVTYVVDRNINYSNVCAAQCDFCAFYRKPDDPEAFLLSDEEIYQKIRELLEIGGTTILLQGSLHPSLEFSYYTQLLSGIKERFDVCLHAFSPPEIVWMARLYGRSVGDIVVDLKNAGLDSIPGGGGEILSDRVRSRVSPRKCTSAEWLGVMEEAHRLGLRTTATMMFGHVETYEDRVEHLRCLRDLQDRTHGFTAFICWTFQPRNTRLAHLQPMGAHEYLKTLAISRIYLDNFPHVQASVITQKEEIGQVALFFGADDMGGTTMEENVVRLAGTSHCAGEQRLRELIRDAGFRPQKRNTRYEWI
ncbi:MAG TPA: cyclic dehypoxanthinyl futalosine synthase [bacterium]|nr:cyclic dehypoxanthinyl futalosine synthase [bacterium]